MTLVSPTITITDIIYKEKKNDDDDIYKFAILEFGDITTGITEEIFVNSNKLDLLKDLEKGNKVNLTIKTKNRKFELHNVSKVK